jgi:DNA-binding response OmpR family regulator
MYMKIMVADNNYELVDMLSYWLKQHRYEVVRAFDSEQAIKNWRETLPDLVIIDIQMLKRVGSEIYQKMRCQTHSTILPLTTAELSADEIHSLEIESNNYLRKPFSPRQLLVLIRSILHRSPRLDGSSRPSSMSTVTVGAITLDASRHEVMRDGRKVRLTPTESRLLHMFMTHAGQILPLDVILNHIRGYDHTCENDLVKTHVRHLRQKVELDASNPEFILTVLGVGYTFSSSEDKATG